MQSQRDLGAILTKSRRDLNLGLDAISTPAQRDLYALDTTRRHDAATFTLDVGKFWSRLKRNKPRSNPGASVTRLPSHPVGSTDSGQLAHRWSIEIRSKSICISLLAAGNVAWQESPCAVCCVPCAVCHWLSEDTGSGR